MSFPDWTTKESTKQKVNLLMQLKILLEVKLLKCSESELNDRAKQQIHTTRKEIGIGLAKYSSALGLYGNYLEEEESETFSPQGFDLGKKGRGRFIEMQILNLRLSTGVNSVTDALILSTRDLY